LALGRSVERLGSGRMSVEPVVQSGKTAEQWTALRDFLATHVRADATRFYGLGAEHREYLDQVVERWFDDSKNYDGRWDLFTTQLPRVGRVLDMASGCGTFVLHGLRNACDVWGIEPEDWKLEYFRRKSALLGLPASAADRVVKAYGESLPFPDGTFDIVTSYQTIEHVADVRTCLEELLRILKVNGVLHLSAPDYRSFHEPHYLVPFLPTMNKKLAAAYLSFIGRPTLGLKYLNWVTERSISSLLDRSRYANRRTRVLDFGEPAIRERILTRLPKSLHSDVVVRTVRGFQRFRQSARTFIQSGPIDGSIDLWVVKTGA